MTTASRRVGPDGLTDKQRRFVEEYLIDYNAAAAARRCGLKSVPAFFTQNEAVRAAIEAGTMIEQDRYGLSREKIMHRLATIAMSDIGQVLTVAPNGEVVTDLSRVMDPKSADRRAIGAISEVTQETYVEGRGENAEQVKRTRVRLHDPKWAVEMLVKMNEWMPAEKVEVTGKDGGPVRVEAKVDLSALSIEELEQLDAIAGKLAEPREGR